MSSSSGASSPSTTPKTPTICLVQSQCCSDRFRNGFAFRVDVQFLGELVNDRHGVIRLEIVIHFGNKLILQILEQSQLLGIIGQCRSGILEAVVGILIGDFTFSD